MAQKNRLALHVRQAAGIAMALAVAGCTNSPPISTPVFETPVTYDGLGVGGSAPATAPATSRAVVKPVEPSMTPLPTITPKPTPIERQTKPRVSKRVTLDADNDGVVDTVDACAGSQAKVIVNSRGCALFGLVAPGVLFAEGSASLDAESLTALNEIVASMEKFPDIRVIVGAYVPKSGDSASDLLLSRRRTIAVIRYMRGAGINAARLRPDANALMAEADNESLANRIAISIVTRIE